MQENSFNITGVIYSKYSRDWTSNKKGKEEKGQFHYYIVEHTENRSGKRRITDQEREAGKSDEYFSTIRNLVEFRLAYGISPEDFNIGDLVKVSFRLRGNEIKRKDGSGVWYKTELEAYYIKYGDIDTKADKGDSGDYPSYKPNKTKDEVFKAPDPDEKIQDYDNLPF